MTFVLFLTIIKAVLPVLVTVALGYFAAWRKDFDAHQAGVLIRLVMLYALPLALFSSILETPQRDILSAGPLAFLILLGMAGFYLMMFGLCRWGLGQCQGAAALTAMTVTGPSVPFVGIPVLGQLFGPDSAVPVSIAALILNLFQVPLTLILMSHDQSRLLRADCVEDIAKAGATSTSPGTSFITSFRANLTELGGHLLHSCREPVVWVPLLSISLVLYGVSMPSFLKGSFLLLGHATGGTALFASGVVLFSRKVRLNFRVGLMVMTRNILIPLGILSIAHMAKLPPRTIQEGVLTMAIPSASINVILSMRYHVMEQEIASVLFFGTFSAVFTLAGFIWLTY